MPLIILLILYKAMYSPEYGWDFIAWFVVGYFFLLTMIAIGKEFTRGLR